VLRSLRGACFKYLFLPQPARYLEVCVLAFVNAQLFISDENGESKKPCISFTTLGWTIHVELPHT
jgi:hypothetical protein